MEKKMCMKLGKFNDDNNDNNRQLTNFDHKSSAKLSTQDR